MARRVAVVLLVTAALVLAGIGAYSRIYSIPDVAQTDVPVFAGKETPPPAADEFAQLAETDPVGMLAACLARYEQDAKGFKATLTKRERVDGKLGETERVRIAACGDVPGPDKATRVRVVMIWDEGARKDDFGNEVRASAYAEGENGGQMLIYRPKAIFLKDFSIDPKTKLARGSSRYCITDAGIYRGMLRTYAAWKRHKDAGDLKTEYLGKRTAPEVGGRECHVVKRTCASAEVDSFALDEQAPTDPKTIERDGFTEVTVFIDAERHLQLGTVIRRANGDLVGEYYFRDVELVRDELPPDSFTAAALRN
ncbi:DUF1571 domain-containing protein [bacterium]|nr:DUF1571 domain-containing protein [bacterium]